MFKAVLSELHPDRLSVRVSAVTCQSGRLSTLALTLFCAVMLSLLPGLTAAALAQQPDTAQDIIYSSDGGGSIETAGNVRTTTLRGNVRIQQGLIVLFGDVAVLEQDVNTGDLIRVTLSGSPARFEREQTETEERIFGSSATIVYYNSPQENAAALAVVEFSGDAQFNRGRTALQCSEILHIVETGATESPGPCSGVLAPAD